MMLAGVLVLMQIVPSAAGLTMVKFGVAVSGMKLIKPIGTAGGASHGNAVAYPATVLSTMVTFNATAAASVGTPPTPTTGTTSGTPASCSGDPGARRVSSSRVGAIV